MRPAICALAVQGLPLGRRDDAPDRQPGQRAVPPANRLDWRDVTVVNGIPVTTVARLLVDLTDDITKWELTNVIHEAAFKKLFHEPATRAAIARANGRRNLNKLDLAIQMHNDGSAGTKSRGELRFLIANEEPATPSRW